MAGASGRLPPVGPSTRRRETPKGSPPREGRPTWASLLRDASEGRPGGGGRLRRGGGPRGARDFFFLPCAFRDVFRPYAEAPARAPGGLQGVRALGDR